MTMWRWFAIALTCLGGAAAAEELVVIESSSAKYAAGAVVADGQEVDLPAGGRLPPASGRLKQMWELHWRATRAASAGIAARAAGESWFGWSFGHAGRNAR